MDELEGTELVKAVAERVMGWPVVRDMFTYPGPFDCPFAFVDTDVYGDSVIALAREEPKDFEEWNPLTDMNDAFEIVAKLQADGWDLSLSHFNGQWVAGFELCGVESEEVEDTVGQAIARAALAATTLKEEN